MTTDKMITIEPVDHLGHYIKQMIMLKDKEVKMERVLGTLIASRLLNTPAFSNAAHNLLNDEDCTLGEFRTDLVNIQRGLAISRYNDRDDRTIFQAPQRIRLQPALPSSPRSS